VRGGREAFTVNLMQSRNDRSGVRWMGNLSEEAGIGSGATAIKMQGTPAGSAI